MLVLLWKALIRLLEVGLHRVGCLFEADASSEGWTQQAIE